MWKLALVLAVISCVLLLSSLQATRGRRVQQFLAFLLAGVALLLGRSIAPRPVASLEDFRPVEVAGVADPYASSASCESCHEDQYRSWHASYHRTMTQIANELSVIGDFDNVHTQAYGHQIRLLQEDGEYWVEMHDPEVPTVSESTMIRRPIVMTTGSHHMQVYWYASGIDRRLGQLPIVWLKETEQWAPIHSIFLRPTQTKLGKAEGRWNQTCIKCHTTQGRPRIDPQAMPQVDTEVAEFGIACEACHGPGSAHVSQQEQAAEDELLESASITNPDKLDHRRSSEVCGQCHGVWVAVDKAEADLTLKDGPTFRPGDRLSDTRHVFSSGQTISAHAQSYLDEDPTFMEDRFWKDGMVRVSGREYNGLIRSPCFQKGELACLSCHDLHPPPGVDTARWANDQLAKDMESNVACIQCHESFADDAVLAAHTHHQPSSSGSLCYNCHMPHTTYGLLKAIRSHEISSPSASDTVEFGRPNACNQCHLDKSLAWTAQSLAQWYDIEPPSLEQEQEGLSAALQAAMTGDAGQRALAAWSLGWEPALAASRSDWVTPILATLLNDPYHAVRFVAHRSLKAQPGFAEFDFNFVGTDQERAERIAAVMSQWQATSQNATGDETILISPSGKLMFDRLQQLYQARNDRTVVLAE